jgi:hypothetical protein
MKPQEIVHLPADTFLADELLNDDGIIEMANLDKSQTGIDGVIWISTMTTGDAPRVKYFLRPGRTQSSFSVTIADQPRVVANSLPPRVVNQMSPLVIQWVTLNKDALLDFWHHGYMDRITTNSVSSKLPKNLTADFEGASCYWSRASAAARLRIHASGTDGRCRRGS